MFNSNGILFNHESPRRGETFVTRKITMAIARILAKEQDILYLGNLESRRDWGFAPEYVEAMWKIMQLDVPDDFVIGTGGTHSVDEFLHEAFDYANISVDKHVRIDKKYYRPTEVESLIADASKAESTFGWKSKITFRELVRIMVDADLKNIGLPPIGEGEEILNNKYPNKWWSKD